MKLNPQDFAKHVETYADELQKAQKAVLKVGLPKEKIGGKAYGNGATVIQIGSVHEFGGTWLHPGGTPYKLTGDGRAIFLKKGDPTATGITRPHKITMPKRSFLRMPFLLKFREIDEVLQSQFKKIGEGTTTTEKALGIVGVKAVNISKKAFSTRGFGKWKPSKKKSGMTLIDKAILRNSITWQVVL